MNQYNLRSTAIGEALLQSRLSQQLPLAAVGRSGYVAISTISAVEHGRRIPSLSVVDSITLGLAEPIGTFDLPYLASANEVPQREAVYHRLVSGSSSILSVQAVLHHQCSPLHVLETSHLFRQNRHVRLLLADLMVRRKLWSRAVVFLRHAILAIEEYLETDFRLRALSLLGKCYLYLQRPERALNPLIEAGRLTQSGDEWESAMVNLGTAWWGLGRYEQARIQWIDAVERVHDLRRCAHAFMGLGNVALRSSQLDTAISYFRRAFELYEATGSPVDTRARALNNLLVAAVRSGDEDMANLISSAVQKTMPDVLSIGLRGELCASMADLAAAQGHTDAAIRLVDQAKGLLGSTPVLSWFSVRFLEITIGGYSPGRCTKILQKMGPMIEQVHDPQLVLAIRARITLLALRQREFGLAEGILNECLNLLPTMGGGSTIQNTGG